jgi:hypothetical protein
LIFKGTRSGAAPYPAFKQGVYITNYLQKNVIIAADYTFGEYFDASMIFWDL